MTEENEKPRPIQKVIVSQGNAQKIASDIVDALVYAKIIKESDIKKALEMAATEILCRTAITDGNPIYTQNYLENSKLYWSKYIPYSEIYDHAFCEVCDGKFALQGGQFTEGYVSQTQYNWICENCFEKLKAHNNWQIITDPFDWGQIMNKVDNNYEIRTMLEEFKIPGQDDISECWLAQELDGNWDSCIFFHQRPERPFYKNILQFWVRAFFSYIEVQKLGSLWENIRPYIEYEVIEPSRFEEEYTKLLKEKKIDPYFLECQQFKKTKIELYDRSFQKSFKIIETLNLKSFLANSDGCYVAIFRSMVA